MHEITNIPCHPLSHKALASASEAIPESFEHGEANMFSVWLCSIFRVADGGCVFLSQVDKPLEHALPSPMRMSLAT